MAECIRLQCLECMGGSYLFVRECETYGCSLWSFRMGDGKPEVTDVPIHVLQELQRKKKAV